MKYDFPITLKRPLVVFDIESTGTSPRADRIIELAAIRLNPDGSSDEAEWLLNPQMKIPVEAIAIHGITDEEVALCPTFPEVAAEIFMFFDGCDLAGFSAGYFDAQILNEEFLRCEIRNFHPEGRALLDAQKIYHKREPRDLTAALRFYCGKELGEAAHGAMADTRATLEVLIGQFKRYPDLPRDIPTLDKLFNPQDPLNVDRLGRWRWVEGEVCVNFGKKKGARLRDLAQGIIPDGRSFLKWMVKSDFPEETRVIAEKALEGIFPTRGNK
ncbi:MAG: 3'-5' exonuclease [Kiritimatiellae bacterium]|nr:3'-5' exonuclease [Kiritimatiellia bacterium]